MITTGKAIYSILSNASAVTALVNSNIYPLVIPESIDLDTTPCIVYERSFINDFTKDGISTTNSSFDFTIISNNYEASINIAIAVFNTLYLFKGDVLNTHIHNISCVGGDEVAVNFKFIQKLSFDVKSSAL